MSEGISNLVVRKATEVISFPDLEHHTGSIGFVEKMILGELLTIVQPKLVVETGTFRGCTTKFVCEFLKKNRLPACRIVAFDLPQVIQEIHKCDPYFASQDNIELVGGLLPASLKRYLETSAQMVDFAIVDSDHSYNAVLGDLETLAPHLQPGSYIFAHDYRRRDPEYMGLTAAVDHFAAMHGFAMLPLNPSDLKGCEVWGSALLRKPAEDTLTLSSLVYHRTLGKVISHMKRAVLFWLRR
jgi:predicted O-methyltransferase YrrM